MRVLIVLAVLLLAGCSEPAPTTDESNGGTDRDSVITDPTDYSYLDDPKDPGAHRHDYWNDQDNLTVVSGSDRLNGVCSGGNGACRMEIVEVRSGTDDVVPQGTAWVDVYVDVRTEHAEGVDFFEVAIKTAEDADYSKFQRLSGDGWLRFNSTNDQNDPPHHRLSLWKFAVRAGTDGDGFEYTGQASIRVHAVRGLEIPLYPSHPDQWNGATTLTLFDGAFNGQASWTAGGWSCGGDPCSNLRLNDGAVIPADATTVEVVVEYVNAGTGVGTPTLELQYHGGDSWDMQAMQPTSEDVATHTYTINTDRDRNDSPYAKQTLWEFRLWPEAHGGIAPRGDYRGTIHVTVTVSK